MAVFAAFFALWAMFALLFSVIGIGLYVLGSYGLYKMAVNDGLENPWLAWIPVADLYIIAKLIKTLNISTFEVPYLEFVLPGAAILVTVLGGVPLIGFLLKIAYFILICFAVHKLYSKYRPEQATLYLIISIILWFMFPVFTFLMKHDKALY